MNLPELPFLNFPEKYQFRLKQSEDLPYIFCSTRKKWLLLTPEEWVRQHTIQFLIREKNYSPSAINSEVIVKINRMKKRADILVFRKEKPLILVECKAPSVEITQMTFDQIARYNLELGADFLMVTNGLNHYYCQMDFENQKYLFMENIPRSTDIER
jgi:hypothetical protein